MVSFRVEVRVNSYVVPCIAAFVFKIVIVRPLIEIPNVESDAGVGLSVKVSVREQPEDIKAGIVHEYDPLSI